MISRRSFVLARGRSRGSESWTVENLAERVFVWSPRLFSFSHRTLSSIRHPYIAVVNDMVDSGGHKKSKRVELLLGALTESRDEEKKWMRISLMFDSMLTADVVDKLRRKVSLNIDVMMRIEVLWNGLGGVAHEVVKEDGYKAFHYKLYSYLLNIDDVSVVTSTSTAISEDYAYDERGNNGVTFEFFAVSMLELADNWTRTRDTNDFVNFLTDIYERCVKTKQRPIVRGILPRCEKTAYFSGGIIRKVVEGDTVTYVKAKQS
ncbi:uncharacterized protein TEOVI_000714600 [Trypanosoma equiperdum]|uniref:Uncharacterized protein n=2 Tax=Trypanozoon TaxID=39700 RepID=Q382G1_TRYB2|nr:hypothetical protein, conserved [Trypanosoma brucei brucei TREU927]EAN80320.1 hypothetical protein, conserved [Trypanosoma brucei brucei TREU927]SCU66259.1 hypothetical protein, conserved [Trypanosoma equiperdum]